MPLVTIAGCMAGKTPGFNEARDLAFYDEGNRAYRFVMTEPGKGEFTFHFALVWPGLVRFDEVASPTLSENSPEAVNDALGAVLMPCLNPKG